LLYERIQSEVLTLLCFFKRE